MSNALTDNTCSDTTLITLNTKNQRKKGEKNGLESQMEEVNDEERGRCCLLERKMMVLWGEKEEAGCGEVIPFQDETCRQSTSHF